MYVFYEKKKNNFYVEHIIIRNFTYVILYFHNKIYNILNTLYFKEIIKILKHIYLKYVKYIFLSVTMASY